MEGKLELAEFKDCVVYCAMRGTARLVNSMYLDSGGFIQIH
jgi:hypothetical protein